MALQVWLPLNGTLENKGLSNVTVTNNGATVDNNGKIGKCYYLSGSTSSFINTGYSTNIGTSDFSIAMWVKIPTISSGSYYAVCTSKNVSATSSGFGIYWNYSQKKFLWSTANGSTSKEIWMSTTVDTLVYNKWIHLVMIRDSNDPKIGYFYINGTRYDLASIPTILNITTDTKLLLGKCADNSYPIKAYYNDIRIYNHALSAKEVKEISKGLILHYKLDGNDIGITIPRNGGLIPDGVELYDYILSSGTLWIDTNFIPTDGSTIMEADVQFSNVLYAENRALMGMYSGSRWHFGVSSSTWHLGMGNLYTDVTPSNIYGRHVINMNSINRLVKIDNNLVYTFNSSLASYSATIWLFKEHRADSVNILSTAKLYYCKFYNNNILVRNFLPCTYLGEPGMWDTVENKFYRNQGTGLFTLGNKITLKEYEYLENTGESYIDTGFKATNGCIFDFEAAWAEYGLCMVGSHNPSSNSSNLYNRNMFIIYNGNKVQFNKYGSCELFSYTCSLNTKYHIYFDTTGTNRIGSINGNEIIRLNNITAINPINNVVIFYGQYASSHHKGKIYTCKLYNSNNQLVRDFIPVSYNGTPGLWDKVEWKFYANAGSGSFTLGPEVTVQQDAPIFYDSSGYCNHGSITGTLTTNSDSPRYIKSTVFSSYTNYITSSAQVSNITNGSVSFWFNPNSVAKNLILMGQTTNLYIAAMLSSKIFNNNAGLSAKLYIDGIESSVSSITDTVETFSGTLTAGWHHYCFINVDLSAWTLLKIGNFNSKWPINGKLSDVRVYATILLEDDVKELYNTSAFVTNNGVFAEYELYEDNLSDVKKRGLLETANFYENGAESGYALDTDKTRVASNYIISEDFIEI